jgi:multidrug efflux pump subunit AcrA (membrane-fusion protein)
MKARLILIAAILAVGAGVFWMSSHHPSTSGVANSGGRKALYYTCAMHPWVHENQPGPCPVCGMDLTPVYEKTALATDTNVAAGEVTLESENISIINVQTDVATNQPVRRTIHLSGQIAGNSSQSAWFEFTAYQRDLEWLKLGQSLEVVVEGVPDKTFTAEIKNHGGKSFADAEFDMMTGSTKMRAEISDAPVQISNFGRSKLFDNLHAEAHLVAETESVLAIPRSAIISRGLGAMVYVDKGNGRYTPRKISLGRIGDRFAEVTAGLKIGEKVVTTGNVLIDSEAQLTSEQ